MKTQKLIKQAEELLGKCSKGPWEAINIYSRIITSESKAVKSVNSPIDYICHMQGSNCPKYKEDCEFIVFSRNHMQEIIDKLKRHEEALKHCLFNPATNKDWSSHDQLIEEIQGVQEVVRQALEEG